MGAAVEEPPTPVVVVDEVVVDEEALRNDPEFGAGLACPPLQPALLTNFEGGIAPPPEVSELGFSFNNPSGFSLGAISYPFASFQAYPLTSEFSAGEWHVSGDVGDYSGFILTFPECRRLEASQFRGLSFTIHGNLGPERTLSLFVQTASNEISHLWQRAQGSTNDSPNAGRCIPSGRDDCVAASFVVPVTRSKTLVQIEWQQFAGGRPSESVDPEAIVGMGWTLPPPIDVGTQRVTTYFADIYLDDLGFF